MLNTSTKPPKRAKATVSTRLDLPAEIYNKAKELATLYRKPMKAVFLEAFIHTYNFNQKEAN